MERSIREGWLSCGDSNLVEILSQKSVLHYSRLLQQAALLLDRRYDLREVFLMSRKAKTGKIGCSCQDELLYSEHGARPGCALLRPAPGQVRTGSATTSCRIVVSVIDYYQVPPQHHFHSHVASLFSWSSTHFI
jgi:hypothetical protein